MKDMWRIPILVAGAALLLLLPTSRASAQIFGRTVYYPSSTRSFYYSDWPWETRSFRTVPVVRSERFLLGSDRLLDALMIEEERAVRADLERRVNQLTRDLGQVREAARGIAKPAAKPAEKEKPQVAPEVTPKQESDLLKRLQAATAARDKADQELKDILIDLQAAMKKDEERRKLLDAELKKLQDMLK